MFNIFKTIKYLYLHPLTKGKGLAVLKKFFYWQFANLLSTEKRIFHWVNDSKLIVGKGETGVTGNYYNGLMEYEDMLFLLHSLRKENIFIDIGANAGVYSVLASKVIGCKTIAFEPINETFERLLDNININRIGDRVTAINKGVGSKLGELYFTNDSDTTNKVSLNIGKNTSTVKVTTIDSEFDESEGFYVLKIDVEGYETEVLKGSENLLKSGKITTIIVELNGSGEEFGHNDNEIDRLICSFGYSAIKYNPINRKIEEIDSPRKFGNTIYVKDIELTKSLCSNAKSVVIHSAFNKTI